MKEGIRFRTYLLYLLPMFALCIIMSALADAADTAAIGGNIYTGSQINGKPNYDTASPLNGARVMVQNQHSGGEFIAYGNVTGNSWTAQVPAGDYVVMFSAKGHDVTSREFTVGAGDTLAKDAYLPLLPLPAANLLVYAFYDNVVNGEDDSPDDPPLNGVTFTVKDKEGNVLAKGVTGSQQTITTADGVVIDPAEGYYYFTNLPPGEVVVSSDPFTAWQGSNPDLTFNDATEFYLTTSEEGGHKWDPKLYPGDPGTEDGSYLIWHGYVQKLGQIGDAGNPTPFNPAIVGSISGLLLDADGNDPAEPFPDALRERGVTPNDLVPEGFIILFTDSEQGPPHPVATVETDPVTGSFSFTSVPPGNYKIFASDIPVDYVWGQSQVKALPGMDWSVSVLLPRFFARARGYVTDAVTGQPVSGAVVNMRLKDGSIWKSEITDASGWYNFDDLAEVEVMGYIDVEPPLTASPGMFNSTEYHGEELIEIFDPDGDGPNPPVDVIYNSNTAYIQWFTFNYRADMQLEKISSDAGDIRGFVFYDNLSTGSWVGDGLYDRKEERTLHGVMVELYGKDPVTGRWNDLVATTATGKFNKALTLAQGWTEPYTWPPDEFGGVYRGPLPGYYEFRDLIPGEYMVKVVRPEGYSYSPLSSGNVFVTVYGGISKEVNLGMNTTPSGSSLGVPLAGEIEGGVFDDLNVDIDPLSLLFMEKAGISGIPVGVYDHLGYLLGTGYMGNPLCYEYSTVCPPGEPLAQKPEMERRFASGVHIYFGNDPNLPGYNPNYLSLALPYEFGQGKYKFEADWSLVPAAFGGLGGAMFANGPVLPENRPVIDDVAPGGSYIIKGKNFGDQQGYSTVTLSGEKLKVLSWSDTEIHVDTEKNSISGPMIVATSTGISNAYAFSVDYTPGISKYMAERSVYVGKGGQYATITEALENLPKARPRYVFVAPGTYNERIHIRESGIHIIGSGPLETIIDGRPDQLPIKSQGFGNGGGPVFFIGRGGEEGGIRNIMISGFTIKGGTVRDEIGAGIFGDYGNERIDINNCIIRNNGGYYGGGIWLHLSNHNVKIWSNIIAENGNFGGYGGGISVNDEPEYGPEHSEPEHILDDHNTGPPPGTYEIFNNLIFHNFSVDYGGGIALYEVKDHLKIYGNIIAENKADDHGGGLFFEDTGPIDIYGNVILRNYCADDGGAISFEDVGDDISVVRIYNNLIAENIADDRGENHARGGGLAFDDTFYVEVFNNTIVGNIVTGSYSPAGGGIDSERNGHEYNGSCPLCRDIEPGFSDPVIYNNIIWNNWRLNYDQQGGEEDDLDYTWGINYRWTPDQLHVDNPNLQDEWDSHENSESFTMVEHNDISGGAYFDRAGNIDIDPSFVGPSGLDWHLSMESSVINMAPADTSPKTDLDNLLRKRRGGMVEMGAYEYRSLQPGGIRIPTGILDSVYVPPPGSE